MSGAEVSLLAVTAGFTVLVVWVYWPSRRQRLEEYAAIPLDDEAGERGTARREGADA